MSLMAFNWGIPKCSRYYSFSRMGECQPNHHFYRFHADGGDNHALVEFRSMDRSNFFTHIRKSSYQSNKALIPSNGLL